MTEMFANVLKVLYICKQNKARMRTTNTSKIQTAFRFDSELLRRLKIKAKQENRSLNNYVETVLMDVVYDEPNEETIEAIREAKSGENMEQLDLEKFDEFVASL